jgi:hypothetical protein
MEKGEPVRVRVEVSEPKDSQLYKQTIRLKLEAVMCNLSYITGIAEESTKGSSLNIKITKKYEDTLKYLNEIRKEFMNE